MDLSRRTLGIRTALLSLFALAAVLAANTAGAQPPPAPPPPELRLSQALESARPLVNGEPLYAPARVKRFYAARGDTLAWSRDGLASAGAHAMIDAIEGAFSQGLDPGDYHLAAIRADRRAHRWVAFDLLLSDAYLTLAHDYAYGRLRPRNVDTQWFIKRPRRVALDAYLEAALAHGDVAASLHALLPHSPGYARLRHALARYRKLRHLGGWQRLAPGPSLRQGDSGSRVIALRQRLRVTGDLVTPPAADPQYFDRILMRAVMHFQRRNGLTPDGVVGRRTRAALNVPVGARIRQIRVNLERWRWLPRHRPARRIQVNVPAFKLHVYRHGKPIFESRVIVGRPKRQTPTFDATVRAVVINPPWNVPRSIAVREELPRIAANPGYLAEKHLQVLSGWGRDAQVVDPSTIDWQQLNRNDFPYHLRQTPGPYNALGRIKFLLPNRFEIYLHDTPARGLFADTRRAFSHGCVRVQRAHDLATLLLSGNPDWEPQELADTLKTGKEHVVPLAHPWPVELLYRTAWVKHNGEVEFRQDLYHRDGPVARALDFRGQFRGA